MFAIRRFTHHHARDEDRTVIAIEHELLIGHIHPDAIGRQFAWKPALAFQISLNHARAAHLGAVGPTCRAKPLQRLAERHVGRGLRRKRLNHCHRIGAIQRLIEHLRHINRFWRKGLSILASALRYGAKSKGLGIGEHRVGEQQVAPIGREGIHAPQQVGVE